MRIFLSLFLATISVSAVAAPFAFRGSYVFKNKVNVVGRYTVDVVDTRMADSRTRLDTLRKDGATCQWVNSNTVRCVSHLPAASVPASSIEKMRANNAGFSVTFNEAWGTPSIVSSGTDLTEWSIPQRGLSPLGSFDHYRYLEMSGGLAKIVLPGTPEPLWLNTLDGKVLLKYESLMVPESRWRWHQDTAELVLSN